MHAALVLFDSGRFIVAITVEHQHYNEPSVYLPFDLVVNLYSPGLYQMTIAHPLFLSEYYGQEGYTYDSTLLKERTKTVKNVIRSAFLFFSSANAESQYFFKKHWRTLVLFVGPLITLF